MPPPHPDAPTPPGSTRDLHLFHLLGLMFRQVDEWNWDVFTFTDICNNKPLVIGGVFLVRVPNHVPNPSRPRTSSAHDVHAHDVHAHDVHAHDEHAHVARLWQMERYGFLDGLDIPRDKLAAFLNAIEVRHQCYPCGPNDVFRLGFKSKPEVN